MINTKHLLKVVAGWVTIVYIICFGDVALIPGVRSWFMHYALHTNVNMGENVITFATFISGFVMWNVIGTLGAWLFVFLYNHTGRRSIKDRRSTPGIAVSATLAAICLGLANPGALNGVPSQMSHEMSGTVQRIDSHTLTVSLAGESKPTVFTWDTKETKFVRDGASTSVDALRVGTQVIIRCSHPLFGPAPVLYRVSWQTGALQKNEN